VLRDLVEPVAGRTLRPRGVLIVQDDPKHPVSLAIHRFADADVAGVQALQNGGAAKPAGRTLMTKRRPRS
jgi:hypothetical protein